MPADSGRDPAWICLTLGVRWTDLLVNFIQHSAFHGDQTLTPAPVISHSLTIHVLPLQHITQPTLTALSVRPVPTLLHPS